MAAMELPTTTPTARGRALDALGWLRPSDPEACDLPERLEQDGYLFLPGLLDRERVRAGRLELLQVAAEHGALDPAHPLEEGVLRPGARDAGLAQEYPASSALLTTLLLGQPLLDFFAGVLGGPARGYDFMWLRAQPPGDGVDPHCDVVFMSRGTPDVLTCWTPFGDIALGDGGLMVLEDSHRKSPRLLAGYLDQDVDTYCANGPNAEAVRSGAMRWEHWDGQAGRDWGGEITDDAIALREQWGGRWLTAPEFRMGDVLIFTMRTVHAGTDNATDRLRLSIDTRYQRADAPVDERWVRGEHGEAPAGHGLASKVAKIC
jgi:Phytanoyl-CoA dioxygenase (PhyH)